MFVREIIKGDGYCIVSSIQKCLEQVKIDLTKEEILQRIKSTFQNNMADYEGFVHDERHLQSKNWKHT